MVRRELRNIWGTSTASWLGNWSGEIWVDVCGLEPVNGDSFCLSSDVNLETLQARLDDFERAIVGALEGCAMGVTTNKHKLGQL